MNAHEIAAGLTTAQREAVLGAQDDGFHRLVDWRWQESRDLEAIGVTGQDGWSDALTPLGLAVRAILQETDR